jgi:hypothetical protein
MAFDVILIFQILNFADKLLPIITFNINKILNRPTFFAV